MGAILWFKFQRENNYIFSEEIYLNYTNRLQFCIMKITYSCKQWKQEQAVDPFGSP